MSFPGYRMGWRISADEPGLSLGSFFARRISIPEPAEFHDFTERTSKGTGGEGRHGYLYWIGYFASLTRREANEIKTIIETGEATNNLIYLTVDRSNGAAGGPNWVDISGRPVMPDFNPLRGRIYENIVLRVNNVDVLGPATF